MNLIVAQKFYIKILSVCFLLFALFFLSSTNANADSISWSTKTSMPTARSAFGAAALNGKIYTAGGYNGTFTNIFEAYDPSTDTWSTKANLPTGRNNLAVVSVGGKIYAIGGWNGSSMVSTFEAYDPSTDTWSTKTSMPTARAGIAAVVGSDGLIYVGGGLDNNNTPLSTFEAYDPSTDTWSTKANLPTAGDGLSLAGYNGKIYAIGGRGSSGAMLNRVEQYDIASNIWTAEASMPTARWDLASVTSSYGIIYAIGGLATVSGSAFTTVEAYNPTTNTWVTQSSLLYPRAVLAAASVNSAIYAMGGNNGGSALNIVERGDIIHLPSKITYFTANDGSNFNRSTTPSNSGLTTQSIDSNGNVTVAINNATGYADSGFVLYQGALGNLPNFTVNGSGNQYGLNLWFDKNNNNEFFAWTNNVMTSLDGDTYGLGPTSQSGIDAISGSSLFYLMSDGQNHSLTDLKNGVVAGISANTRVAVWIGVNTSSGSTSATITSVNGL